MTVGAPTTHPTRGQVAVVPFGARTVISLVVASAVGVMAFAWPLLASPESEVVAHAKDAPWLFALLLPLILAVVLAQVADGGLDAKGIAMLGVMSAVAAALRPFGGGTAGFEPMWIVLILGGRAFGPGFGFALGTIGMFASALLTGGAGPWLPFQMIAAGWVGLGAGLLPRRPAGRAELAMLSAYAFLACVMYGFVMNLWFWPFLTTDSGLSPGLVFQPGAMLPENLANWLRFSLTTSLGYDLPRAALAVVLVAVAGRPVLLAVRRAGRRAAFGASVEFSGPTAAPDPADTASERPRSLT